MSTDPQNEHPETAPPAGSENAPGGAPPWPARVRRALGDWLAGAATFLRDFSSAERPALVALKGGMLLLALGVFLWAFLTPLQEQTTRSLYSYRQNGDWNYRLHLIPNSLTSSTEQTDQSIIFARLVDTMIVSYRYQYEGSTPAQETMFVYRASVTMNVPEVWERNFITVPDTRTALDDFTVEMAVPVRQMLENFDQVQEETDADVGRPEIRITVEVLPQVQSGYGAVRQPFSQTIVFDNENGILKTASALSGSSAGGITETAALARPQLAYARWASSALLLAALYFMINTLWSAQDRRRASPAWQRELTRAERKLRGMLVHTRAIPPEMPGQQTIQMEDLDSMVKLAVEAGQPLIYSQGGGGVRAILPISNALRYEYTSARRRGEDSRDEEDYAR